VDRLQGNTVEKVLQNFGLTEKETQIYIYLAKHGIQKGGEIAKKTRTAKAVVYRILKTLQRKGFIESTLESPVRFKAIPFETILDLEIKSKHEEALQIETSKKDLLADWSKISRGEPESPIEKFVVLEGDRKIYSKMYQMVKQTKKQLSIIATVSGIMRSDRYGITNAIINHPLNDKILFRFLTDITNADLNAIRFIKKKLRASADLRGRNPELGTKPFPRMVIRDQEEILFFVTPNAKQNSVKTENTCLSTNCKSLIQAFSGVFEDLWLNSTDMQKKIIEVETGEHPSKTIIITDPEEARTKYNAALNAIEKEIMIVTSARGLFELEKQESRLEEWFRKNVSIKIMAPITNENLDVTKQLLHWCEIRHIPLGYFETTITDDQHLFQFNRSYVKSAISLEIGAFGNTLYTNDSDYIKRTSDLLNNIWRETRTPSDFLLSSLSFLSDGSRELHQTVKKLDRYGTQKIEQKTESNISEVDVLNKISEARSNPSEYWSKTKWSDVQYFFGSRAFALIQAPKRFNLPDMIIAIFQNIECSAFGLENMIRIFVKPEIKSDAPYQLVAQIQDSSKSMNYNLAAFKGMAIGTNIKLVRTDQLSVILQGNTLFAGWTVPIQISSSCVLPPSCILFEGYGNIKSGIFNFAYPSGRKNEVWFNNIEAFATLFSQKSKYVGAASECVFDRESIQISYPP
jgi:sugar-specific transcriptional regulator TrmB